MFNPDNCRYVVWGYKNHYTTHGHIHSGFERTLRLTGKQVVWLDEFDDISNVDCSNSLFITEHQAAKRGMPIRDDCFYLVHGLRNDPEASALLAKVDTLGWNVYHDYSHGAPEQWDGKPIHTLEEYNHFMKNIPLDTTRNYDRIFLAEDTPYYPKEKHLDFRWATDLIPSEIESNKPGITLTDNKIIYWVGSKWFVNSVELDLFQKACNENGVEFKQIGAGQNGVVSIEDNIRLVRESYFSPAISGGHHPREGYAPCRIFKNISYGRMGITNSAKVDAIFGNRLIFCADPYELFYKAVACLKDMPVSCVHELMDYVSANHTYVNRLDSIMKAVKLVLEDN